MAEPLHPGMRNAVRRPQGTIGGPFDAFEPSPDLRQGTLKSALSFGIGGGTSRIENGNLHLGIASIGACLAWSSDLDGPCLGSLPSLLFVRQVS
ncbi:MAG: hypothetical protein ACC655_01690 [Rhodothermia bacterium]